MQDLEITPFCCDFFLFSSECLQVYICLANHHISKLYHVVLPETGKNPVHCPSNICNYGHITDQLPIETVMGWKILALCLESYYMYINEKKEGKKKTLIRSILQKIRLN